MSEQHTADRLLSVKDAAQCLAVSRPTLARLMASKKIKFVKIGRKAVRIPLSALNQVIENGIPPSQD